MNNIKVSKNFSLNEFQCRDGSYQVVVSSKLLVRLQQLRELVGKPIIITSGYRNQSHNATVGGSPTSRHLTGEAADIKVEGMFPDEVAQLAQSVGFTGIGIYKSFTHVDVREKPTRWKR